MSETYSGRGTLIVEGTEYPCVYRIAVFESRSIKSGSGTIDAEPAAIWAAFNADRASIRGSGWTFPVIVTNHSGGSLADVALAGAPVRNT